MSVGVAPLTEPKPIAWTKSPRGHSAAQTLWSGQPAQLVSSMAMRGIYWLPSSARVPCHALSSAHGRGTSCPEPVWACCIGCGIGCRPESWAEAAPPARTEFEGWQDAPMLLRPRLLPNQVVQGMNNGRIPVNTTECALADAQSPQQLSTIVNCRPAMQQTAFTPVASTATCLSCRNSFDHMSTPASLALCLPFLLWASCIHIRASSACEPALLSPERAQLDCHHC